MRGGPDLAAHEREPSYAQSVRRHCEAERQEILQERLHYHRSMIEAHARTLERIIEGHRAEVEKLEGRLRMTVNDDERKSA